MGPLVHICFVKSVPHVPKRITCFAIAGVDLGDDINQGPRLNFAAMAIEKTDTQRRQKTKADEDQMAKAKARMEERAEEIQSKSSKHQKEQRMAARNDKENDKRKKKEKRPRLPNRPPRDDSPNKKRI
jgi:hypothetical protein